MPSHSRAVLASIQPAVPPELAERAAAWGPAMVPAPPILSASVVLVRHSSEGLQTYLLHRHARMAFAASMAVFPGGGVDAVDHGAADPVRQCAVRETAEETGVRLQQADLHDWAHWTTPECEPRRYDTHFYLAVLPTGQQARDISGETDRADWTRPVEALTAADHGHIALMPPTRSILVELAAAGRIEDLLAAAVDRVVEPVLPRLLRTESGWSFEYPQPSAASSFPTGSA